MQEEMNLLLKSMGMPIWLFFIMMVWSLSWKLAALWNSARRNSLGWFLILALVNTMGILEILYIFVFSKMKCCELNDNTSKLSKKKQSNRKK